jgi:hypothetical protein
MSEIEDETEYIVGEVEATPSPNKVGYPLEDIWHDDKIEKVSSFTSLFNNVLSHFTLLTLVSSSWMAMGSHVGNAFGVALYFNIGMQQRLFFMSTKPVGRIFESAPPIRLTLLTNRNTSDFFKNNVQGRTLDKRFGS